jgi:hypothetical protein
MGISAGKWFIELGSEANTASSPVLLKTRKYFGLGVLPLLKKKGSK